MLNFLKKSIFGLSISDYSIKVVVLGGSVEKPKLLAMSREVLGPGTIEDGKILHKERLRIALKSSIEKPNFSKIRTRKLIFALPESKTFIRTFKTPKTLNKKAIKKEIELQIVQNFPFSLKDLYYNFKIENREALLVAAQKDVVDDYLKIFRELKLKPVALEIESLSLARSLVKDKEKTDLIADIGARTTSFSIFDRGRLKLSITIDIAGDSFTKALAEKLNISFSKAEIIKKEVGLDPDKREGKVFLILQREIQKIISEIKKISEYFQEKENKPIDKIILTGGSANLFYLTEYLTENLKKPVIVGDPWKIINIDILKSKEYFKKAHKLNPIAYSVVIGSALRGLTKEPRKTDINLI